MCGRYTLRAAPEALATLFGLGMDEVRAWRPRYNVAPTQAVLAVIAARGGHRHARPLRWGLVPHWADDPTMGNRLINARSESVASKPAFRGPMRYRRCLIPADGFYEWKKAGGGARQPYHVRLEDGRLFAFAGLYDHWQSEEGAELETCTILTTRAAGPVRQLPERMPVILPEQAYGRWLDPAMQDAGLAADFLRLEPPPLVLQAVSRRVNRPMNDDPACLQPPEDEGDGDPPPGTQGGLF